MWAEALFERIGARSFREVRLHLTDAAVAHGIWAFLPERLGISVNGRGERTRAYTFQIYVTIVDGDGRSIVSRSSDVA
jgi:hypothetical protein